MEIICFQREKISVSVAPMRLEIVPSQNYFQGRTQDYFWGGFDLIILTYLLYVFGQTGLKALNPLWIRPWYPSNMYALSFNRMNLFYRSRKRLDDTIYRLTPISVSKPIQSDLSLCFPFLKTTCAEYRISNQLEAYQSARCGSILVFYEPGHSIFYKIARAPNEVSDQPAHPHKVIRVFHVNTGSVPSKDFDQSVRMSRLIWAFPGRTCNLVGNTVSRLMYNWFDEDAMQHNELHWNKGILELTKEQINFSHTSYKTMTYTIFHMMYSSNIYKPGPDKKKRVNTRTNWAVAVSTKLWVFLYEIHIVLTLNI